LAIVKAPIVQPRAGEIIFVKASPNRKACTATCDVIPKVLAIGSKIGISTAAFAVADGTIGFNIVITDVIPITDIPLFKFISGFVIKYTIVSNIFPSTIIICIVEARPITNVTNAIAPKPLAKELPN